MTRNHSHDTELAGLIDRLVDEGQLTGHAALDDLARTVPQSSPEFKHALEARLLAALQTKPQERKTIMQHVLRFPIDTARPHSRPIRPAYTLIAAVLGIVLFAVALFVISTHPPQGPSFMAAPPAGDEAQPAAQASPTLPPGERATATPTQSPVPDFSAAYTYIVQPGDTCLSVAYQFGHTSLDAITQIIALNQLSPLCVLPSPGAIILVPPPEGLPVPAEPITTGEAPEPQSMEVTVVPTALRPEQLTATSIIDVVTATASAGDGATATPIPAAPGAGAQGPQNVLWPVVIAGRAIEAGSAIDAEDLIVTYWPGDAAPPAAVSSPAQVLAGVASEDIPQWQPILADQVALEE